MTAGLVISIGGYIYLNCIAYINSPLNKIIGAVLFSFGLLSIVYYKWSLFTGKAGFAKTAIDHHNLMFILIGNLLGVILCGLFARLFNNSAAQSICQTLCEDKIKLNFCALFTRSIACGALMYLAIYGWKNTSNPLMVMLPVVIFIISGFEHSIADGFYFAYGANFSMIKDVIKIMCVIIVGNYCGAQVVKYLTLLPKCGIMEQKAQ